MKAILKRLSVVALMAAIAFCFGVPVTTHAATTYKTGWNQVGSDWVYSVNGTDLVKSTPEPSGDKTFYLGSDGKMVRNKFVNEGTDMVPVIHYYGADGAMVVSSWQVISGATYHFDATGLMDTGTKTINAKEYFFGKDGKMVTGLVNFGTIAIPDIRCFNASGAMVVSDWQLISGAWYYFDGTGAMETATPTATPVTINAKDYLFGKDGKMLVGWVKADNGTDWLYAGPSGDLQADKWVNTNGVWYYLGATGIMASNAIIPNSDPTKPFYFVNKDGSWKNTKGWVSEDEYVGTNGVLAYKEWVLISGIWYHFDANHKIEKNTTITDADGSTWFLNASGEMVTKAGMYDLYRAAGGKLFTGWTKDADGKVSSGDWKYYEKGVLKEGWLLYNGSWYFLAKTTGVMATGLVDVDADLDGTPDGTNYFFSASGAMQIGTFKIVGETDTRTFGPSGAEQ